MSVKVKGWERPHHLMRLECNHELLALSLSKALAELLPLEVKVESLGINSKLTVGWVKIVVVGGGESCRRLLELDYDVCAKIEVLNDSGGTCSYNAQIVTYLDELPSPISREKVLKSISWGELIKELIEAYKMVVITDPIRPAVELIKKSLFNFARVALKEGADPDEIAKILEGKGKA